MIYGQLCSILMLVWIMETIFEKVSVYTYFFVISRLTSPASVRK